LLPGLRSTTGVGPPAAEVVALHREFADQVSGGRVVGIAAGIEPQGSDGLSRHGRPVRVEPLGSGARIIQRT
jgi:hypothetical protein